MSPEELAVSLARAFEDAVSSAGLSVPSDRVPAKIQVERPKKREHGDWSSNVALQFAQTVGLTPRDFAEILRPRFAQIDGIDSVTVAGPGFLNFVLQPAAAGALAHKIVLAASDYGQNSALAGHSVNLEFVSANPTGPLHVGHTRWAALGDAIGRLLRFSGARVTTEYYINDAGKQMEIFAASVLASLRNTPPPEDGYRGGYIDDLARRIAQEHPYLRELTDTAAYAPVLSLAYEEQMRDIRETLEQFDVCFEVFFSERQLHASGAVTRAIDRLRAQGHVDDRDGAVWLRTSDFGDDKDRVLLRSDGSPTYFAADAAYYLDKKDRGFEEKIYFLGADHHGYVARLRAIAACAGDDPDRNIEILIGQLVSVNGARLSKRAGNIVELRDLLSWLGSDALRYMLARYPADSPLTLDPELLKKASNDNPVFYVQYAHARTCAVARNAEIAGIGTTPDLAFDPALLHHEREKELLSHLAAFPTVVAEAAGFREPHRVARYLESLAGTYHRWYDVCRVVPRRDEPVRDTNKSRLWLNDATRQVLANGLWLLGVSAPERM